jgi:hypothetical protein
VKDKKMNSRVNQRKKKSNKGERKSNEIENKESIKKKQSHSFLPSLLSVSFLLLFFSFEKSLKIDKPLARARKTKSTNNFRTEKVDVNYSFCRDANSRECSETLWL